MRLSDIHGERVFDVIADIIDPVANIAQDNAASALFRRERLPEGMTAKNFLVWRARKSLPVLFKEHKGDIIAILAAIEGVSEEQYKRELTLVKLMQDATELLSDEAFSVLFISAQSENSSGSARENTKGKGE